MTELFRAEGLRREFGGRRRQVVALDDVSLTVTAGQRLGIVGESGSGKSTLIKLLAALDRPTSGAVHFGGRRVDTLRERELGFLRSQVQLVFQDPRSSLNPRLRVGDIIAEPLRSRLLRRRDDVPDDPQPRVAELLAKVGLPADAVSRYPHEFSGGQRQRIAIARALAPAPSVLIADEPVSALDVSVRAHVLNLLDELVDTMGLTLLFVSHDLAVVRHVCTDVIVMRNGRIVEAGTRAQVYDDPHHEYTKKLLASVPTLDRRRSAG